MLWSWSSSLVLLVLALTLTYLWMRHRFQYWSQRGFQYIKPVPIFGNFLPVALQRQTLLHWFQDAYEQLKKYKYGGTFMFFTPSLLITDPDLIKEITVKSFDHFSDRRTLTNDRTDPLTHRALISLKGQEWREMRNTLSPTFTTSKLRAMFPLITKCGEQFAHFLTTRPDVKNSPLEFKTTFTRFTNDVIATVAFGIECNAVQNPNETFYQFGQKAMNPSKLRTLLVMGYIIFPKLMSFLRISLMPRSITDFFRSLINNAKKIREENNVVRPDLLHILMTAQKGGTEHQHGDEQDSGSMGEAEDAAKLHLQHLAPEKRSNKVLTDDDITAQAFLFFLGGFETESVLLSFMTYVLAVNPDIQNRLRQEVDDVLLENNGKLNYDLIQGMKYMDMVISETMRMYPPGGGSERVCTKNFKIPGTDNLIEKGMIVALPFYALHHDPQYFPEPQKFDPERFNDENRPKIKPYTYLPFGSGPHNCIGMRLALLEAKVCMSYILATSELRVCEKTPIPLHLSKKSFQMTAEGGFWMLCVPREYPTINIDL